MLLLSAWMILEEHVVIVEWRRGLIGWLVLGFIVLGVLRSRRPQSLEDATRLYLDEQGGEAARQAAS